LIYLKEGEHNMNNIIFIKRFVWFTFAFITFFLSNIQISAQEITVSAKLDTNQIKIGKQACIKLEAKAPKGTQIIFPQLKDTITEKIELVNVGKIDTVQAGNLITYTSNLIITSFDSGFFAIPPFSFGIKNDTSKHFETDALLIAVQTVPVDTTLAIKAIKPPIDPSWSIFEIQNELLMGFALLIAIVALIYFLKRRKKIEIVEEIKVVKRPAHEIALESLNELRNQKLWQQGRVKQYHIVIADTLRTYIENRYSIGAMEMTSEEIIRSLRLIIVDAQLKSKLSSVLILSDMVKFAKEQPLPNENELSWEQAVEFIKQTALVHQLEVEKL
jgi:hypothetical protein